MEIHIDQLQVITLILTILQSILMVDLIKADKKIRIHDYVKLMNCPMRKFCRKYRDSEEYIHSKICSKCKYAIERFEHKERKTETQAFLISLIPLIGAIFYILSMTAILKNREKLNEFAPKSITNYISKKLIRTERT